MRPPYKGSDQEFSQSTPLARIRKLKWWFWLLLILGLAALVTVLVIQGGKTFQTALDGNVDNNPLSVRVVQAQQLDQAAGDNFTPRVIIIAGVFAILGIVYLAGIFKLFFSRNSAQVETAADLMKTLTGFFVGAATGFLG